jgi:predicted nuclease with RNAse H fold
MSNDVVLKGDTPFLATCDAPLDLINNRSIDHVNTEMMNVSWRMFPLIDIFRVMNKETLRLALGALLS